MPKKMADTQQEEWLIFYTGKWLLNSLFILLSVGENVSAVLLRERQGSQEDSHWSSEGFSWSG